MESEKENTISTRLKSTTASPLKTKHLSEDLPQKKEEKRKPLHTIANNTDNKQDPKRSTSNNELKNVTVRNKVNNDSDLDWDLIIFEDKIPIVTISDDETEQPLVPSEPSTSTIDKKVTPHLNVIENRTVKNIKKSLKRPHSQELQGISARNEGFDRTHKKCRNERIFDRIKIPDEASKKGTHKLMHEFSNDIFQYLLTAESRIVQLPRIPDATRACIVNWLMKINGPNGNPATLQTACWFLDSLLGNYDVVLQNLQLIATACYWIAQKFQGPVMSSTFLVKYVRGAFTVQDLLYAERRILKYMNFPTTRVIAHDFVTYFVECSDLENPGEMEVAASFIVKAGLLVKPLLACELPSVIAAAAVKNAFLLLRRKCSLTNLLVNPIYRAAERKAVNLNGICAAQRDAITTIASPNYKYKACFEHYSAPPFYLAKKIANAAARCYMKREFRHIY